MKEFEVPQIEVSATVELHGGASIAGTLFAAPQGPGGRPSRILARLNDDAEDFLPFSASGQRRLINRNWIVSVRLSADEVSDSVLGADADHPLRLELSTGVSLSGSVRYAAPIERRRLSDFLNSAPRFVAVHVGSGVVLVQRRFIVQVEDLG